MKNLRFLLIVLLVLPMLFTENTNLVLAENEKDGYLIISSVSKQNLITLIEYRESKGLDVYFVDIEDIDKPNQDDDITPIIIRDFLLEHKEEWNLKFLLIVGTHKKVPMLIGKPDPEGLSHEMVGNTLTDFFYSTPSANWDRDGDGNFGELKDDGVAAFKPELFVGRIPFDSEKDVTKIAEQIVEFDNMTDAQKSKCLFPGGILGFKGQLFDGQPMERGDGGEFSELLFEDHFMGKGFSRYRMYEADGFLSSPYTFEEPLTNSNLKGRFAEKFGLVCWTGHGSPDRVVRTVWKNKPGGATAPEEKELSQPKLVHTNDIKRTKINWGIVLAASCSTSNPRILYNLGASTLRAGCASYIGSTNVCWGPSFWKGPSDGGMETILYLFTEYIIKPGTTTGQAMDNALYEFADKYFWGDTEDPPEASQMNIFNFNLYGDPAVTLVSGDNSPRISIAEPTVSIEKGEVATWQGEIIGNPENIERIQVIPAKTDMLWAFPEIEMDFKKSTWKIEIHTPADIKTGKREWLIYQFVGKKRIIKSLVLNIYREEKSEFSHMIIPEKLAPYREFEVDLNIDTEYATSEFVIKFNPNKLHLNTILFADRKKKGGWFFIDNFFGMAVATYDGKAEKDVASLVFSPKKGFKEDKISILNLRVADLNGETLCSLPHTIQLTAEEDEIIRSRADFNKSGFVDMIDLSLVVLRFGTQINDSSNWDPSFDLNEDGLVNVIDYGLTVQLLTPTP